MDLHTWGLFASIALMATLTPGPAVLLATSHSATHGFTSALVAILGHVSGLFIMSALSVLGLSAILLSSELAFTAVRLIGAAYLIYLGVRLWRGGRSAHADGAVAAVTRALPHQAYLKGLGVALSNPKAIAFTTALFPQFISPERDLLPQFLLLVATFMTLSFSCLAGYAYAGARLRQRWSGGAGKLLGRLFGSAFVAAGELLAGAGSKA